MDETIKLTLLDESVLEQLPDNRRSVFILDWLIKLDQSLSVAKNVSLFTCSPNLIDDL